MENKKADFYLCTWCGLTMEAVWEGDRNLDNGADPGGCSSVNCDWQPRWRDGSDSAGKSE